MNGPAAVIADHTALVALGAGDREMSRLVAAAHGEADRYVYAPGLCLAAAVAQRPALADHIGQLPAIEVIEMAYASACVVGSLIADGVDWRVAHAIDAARPSPDWPAGRPIVTAHAAAYAHRGVTTIALPG